jgi:hypothetical protein
MMNLVIDIYSTKSFITKFCETYKIDNTGDNSIIFKKFFDNIYDICFKRQDYDKILGYDNYVTLIHEFDKTHVNDNKHMDVKTTKIGQSILVTFMPLSQKYIEYYDTQKISGMVYYIDCENNDMLIVKHSKDTITVHSLEREYCSYYGDTPSYMYDIKLSN